MQISLFTNGKRNTKAVMKSRHLSGGGGDVPDGGARQRKKRRETDII